MDITQMGTVLAIVVIAYLIGIVAKGKMGIGKRYSGHKVVRRCTGAY